MSVAAAGISRPAVSASNHGSDRAGPSGAESVFEPDRADRVLLVRDAGGERDVGVRQDQERVAAGRRALQGDDRGRVRLHPDVEHPRRAQAGVVLEPQGIRAGHPRDESSLPAASRRGRVPRARRPTPRRRAGRIRERRPRAWPRGATGRARGDGVAAPGRNPIQARATGRSVAARRVTRVPATHSITPLPSGRSAGGRSVYAREVEVQLRRRPAVERDQDGRRQDLNGLPAGVGVVGPDPELEVAGGCGSARSGRSTRRRPASPRPAGRRRTARPPASRPA